MVSPSPGSPRAPTQLLAGDFSDDDSMEAEMPSWSPEMSIRAGGGVSGTPSPTAVQGFGPGSGRRNSARSSGSGSSGGQGGAEEDASAARAAEARAAATAMFSQLPGTTRLKDDDPGCATRARARTHTHTDRVLTTCLWALHRLRPRSAATPKFSTGLNGDGYAEGSGPRSSGGVDLTGFTMFVDRM